MMAIIFNGLLVAREKEDKLVEDVKELGKKEIVPKMVSILVGDNPASKKYLLMKKTAAERVGVKLEVMKVPTKGRSSSGRNQLIKLIKDLNKDIKVHGIMVQLPLPSKFSNKDRNQVINSIAKTKDVDGMRENSNFIAPVVKAVIAVLSHVSQYTIINKDANVLVVGSKGFVGGKILKALKEMDYQVKGVDIDTDNLSKETKQADILVSATGKAGLIKESMVKKGAVVIDVGSPTGDVITKKVLKKAQFISPSPGGVGPLTIYYLLENLIEAVSN